MRKYIKKDEHNKEVPFQFKNKVEEKEYVDKCLKLWGAIPVDVDWAQGTSIYKNLKILQ